MQQGHSTTGLEIAIIGMAGRFPGSPDLRQFWQNLANGQECISVFSDEELLSAGVNPEEIHRPGYVKARGILENSEAFDAGLFKFTPREAEITDPQQRIFLECCWEAFEDAGYVPNNLDRLVGVFAGVATSTYFFYQVIPSLGGGFAFGDTMAMLGNEKDFLPTRVSYKLNLKGPSAAISTGCSSSLVATHMACKSLLAGECDMAVAGGASIRFPLKSGYAFGEGGFASPDGHCRAFDEKAQGSVFGSGVGVVILKRLEDALADRDFIYAVIKGSATNNDGSRRVGFTAPSIEGQADVIRMARLMADIDPDSVTYIEAHGSGTPIGDPIEIQALIQSSGPAKERTPPCAIGSVKTNIGHTSEAAGVAGLIKTVLSLMHRKIPPSLHFSKPNPKLGIEGSRFYVNDSLKDWPVDNLPLRAGVSSFGIGGTNAHVVLEEAPAVTRDSTHRRHKLVLLSARSAVGLETSTNQLITYLTENKEANMADVAFTLHVGRKAFDYRRALVCTDVDDALAALKNSNRQKVFSNSGPPIEVPKIVMMFPGLGDDHPGMAAELYQTEPAFRAEVERCLKLLEPDLRLELRKVLRLEDSSGSLDAAVSAPKGEVNLRKILYRANGAARASNMRTDLSQLSLFITEFALGRLWMHWGLEPSALIGYSLGELVAACIAEVFSLEAGIRIVAARGKLIQALPPGAMLAVPLPEAELERFAGDALCVAAVNGPTLGVLAGPVNEIEAIQSRLKADGVDSRRVLASHPLHSRLMYPIASTFTEFIEQFALNPPKIPYLSNVTGNWIRPEEACSAEYWARHLCEPIRFGDGIEKLFETGARIFLEIGPGQTLCSLVMQHPGCKDKKHLIALQSLSSVYDNLDDGSILLSTAGRLWLEGWCPNWNGFHANDRRSRISLPPSALERKVYRVRPISRRPPGAAEGDSSIPLTDPDISKNHQRPGAETAALAESVPFSSNELTPLESTQSVLPENELQRKIADIWYGLLGIDQMSLHDNFFQIGGDSLLGTRLLSRLSEVFPVKPSLRLLWENPTIASLSAAIEGLLLQELEHLSDEEAAQLAEHLG